MPFFLIFQEFLIFTNLNVNDKPIISIQNWKDVASYCCLNGEDVVIITFERCCLPRSLNVLKGLKSVFPILRP